MTRKEILSLLAKCADQLDQQHHYRQADAITKVMLRVSDKMLLNDDFAEDFTVPPDVQSDKGELPCEGMRDNPQHPFNKPTRFYPDLNGYFCLDCANEKLRPKDRWSPYGA